MAQTLVNTDFFENFVMRFFTNILLYSEGLHDKKSLKALILLAFMKNFLNFFVFYSYM